LRALINDSNGNSISAPYTWQLANDLDPGSSFTKNWSYTFTSVGEIYVKFEVWTKSPVTSAILLATAPDTGGVFITAQERVKFIIGDNVTTNVNVHVYQSPGLNSPEITHPNYHGQTNSGTQGSVLKGPTSATPGQWWLINFGIYEGWVREEFLVKN
jgi:hypothetical protein